ncbi:hypothetical protein CIW54_28865 [Paraburkholderia sp. T12-10]|nr:hypothetical protein CIW54_28865 [Paraburkholderia sp. T12-10]
MAKSFRLYTLHAQIRDINPPIWRRLQIEGFASLRRLHHTLQAAFGCKHLAKAVRNTART